MLFAEDNDVAGRALGLAMQLFDIDDRSSVSTQASLAPIEVLFHLKSMLMDPGCPFVDMF